MLQGDLWQFGFDPGWTTGPFDARTERALLAYQASRGLARNGLLDLVTLRRLLADCGLPTTGPLLIGSAVPGPGDEGPPVRMLQADVQQLGLHPGPAEGRCTTTTGAALLAYQASRHLTPTGVLNAATLRQLASELATGGWPAVGTPGSGGQGATGGGTPGGGGGGAVRRLGEPAAEDPDRGAELRIQLGRRSR